MQSIGLPTAVSMTSTRIGVVLIGVEVVGWNWRRFKERGRYIIYCVKMKSYNSDRSHTINIGTRTKNQTEWCV